VGDLTPEEMGCQLWGVMGRFLTYGAMTDREIDAIKRRMFGFMDTMKKHDYTMQDIRELATQDDIRGAINELTLIEAGEMFA